MIIPSEIIESANKVSEFMEKNGYKRWELDSLCCRSFAYENKELEQDHKRLNFILDQFNEYKWADMGPLEKFQPQYGKYFKREIFLKMIDEEINEETLDKKT